MNHGPRFWAVVGSVVPDYRGGAPPARQRAARPPGTDAWRRRRHRADAASGRMSPAMLPRGVAPAAAADGRSPRHDADFRRRQRPLTIATLASTRWPEVRRVFARNASLGDGSSSLAQSERSGGRALASACSACNPRLRSAASDSSPRRSGAERRCDRERDPPRLRAARWRSTRRSRWRFRACPTCADRGPDLDPVIATLARGRSRVRRRHGRPP